MEENFNIQKIRELVEQYKKFNESSEKLMKLFATEDVQENWDDNYHLIDHDYIVKWKDSFFYDNLEKIKNLNYDKIYEYIKNNYQEKDFDKLNKETIYYVDKNNHIDPMKQFDIISHEVWDLFDMKNNNSNYNGRVSIKKGNRKILVRLDDNNYYVKYLTNEEENLFGEFLIIFDSNEKKDKDLILNDIAKANIYKWMDQIDFKSNLMQFKVNKYPIHFDIKQKTNNYRNSVSTFKISKDFYNEAKKYASFSMTSFSFSNSFSSSLSSSFLSSREFSNYFDDTTNFRMVLKFEQTSHIYAVMRCLSMIDPLANYFMSIIKGRIIFSRFQSNSLLNLIRKYFLNLWSNEKDPYAPKKFIKYIKDKAHINISEEQDPIIFFEYILKYINKKLNNIDMNTDLQIKELLKNLKNQPFSNKLEEIIKMNNSIIGENFLGLILETYDCKNCKKKSEILDSFYHLDIEYMETIKIFLNDANSLTDIEMDDFLEYFFLKKELDNSKLTIKDCPHCGKQSKIIKREIVKYPKYLIIKLILGEFEGKKGFRIENKDMIEYVIKYDNVKYLESYSFKIENNYKSKIYNLLSAVCFYYEDNKIKFSSICISPINKKNWISFICNSAPTQITGYANDKLKPYILFYELKNKE